MVFGSVSGDGRRPDYEIMFAPYGMVPSPTPRPGLMHGTLEPSKESVGLVALWSCHPTNRGEVTLRSTSPDDPPVIAHELLAPSDVDVITAAGRQARAILASQAFGPFVTGERMPGLGVESDADWDAYIRTASGRGFHQSGTCRMGIDDGAVVGPDLRVHGIDGLRVVDASVCPCSSAVTRTRRR
jgi:choline dehydrogenase